MDDNPPHLGESSPRPPSTAQLRVVRMDGYDRRVDHHWNNVTL